MIIVGGGPAGLRAAEVAARRGHKVILYEKADRLGGQVNIAALGAGREELKSVIRNAENQLKLLPVEIILNKEATADFVMEQNPGWRYYRHRRFAQAVSASRRRTVPISLTSGRCLPARRKSGRRVLFIDNDGHHQATATIEFLVDRGSKVHIVTNSATIGSELGPTQDSVSDPPAPGPERRYLHAGLRRDRD